MSKKLKRKIGLFLINNLFSGTHFFKVKRNLLKMSGISVGKDTKIVGPLHIGTVAELTIGDNSWVGTDLKIYGNGKVYIGNCCDIAPEVAFVTGSHEIETVGNRRAGKGVSYEIYVKDGCWIGCRCSISGNTVIERGCVIGACSYVNKSLLENHICYGVPAKPQRHI